MLEIELPKLTLGAVHLEGDASQFLEEWYQTGGRSLDTARVYNGGKSERAIGEWLAQSKHEDVAVVSKCCHPDFGNSNPRMSKACLDEDLKISMDLLQKDSIDVYLYHRDDPTQPPEEILDWMQEHVDQGKIKAIGVSNWHHQRIQQANVWAKKNDKTPFSINSPQYSATAPSHWVWSGCLSISGDQEAIQWHQQDPLAPHILAWQPLGAGFLTEREAPTSGYLKEAYESFMTATSLVEKQKLLNQAKSAGLTLPQIALKWIIDQPKAHAIVGTTSIERWKEALAITSLS